MHRVNVSHGCRLNFRTGFRSTQGNLVMEPAPVAWHYFRTWFFVDVLSFLPFDLLATDSGQGLTSMFQASRAVRVIRLLRLLKMVKLLRLLRVPTMIRRMEFFMGRSFRKLCSMLVCAALICHFSACVFYIVAFECVVRAHLISQIVLPF